MSVGIDHVSLGRARLVARLPQFAVIAAGVVLCLLGLRDLVAGPPRPIRFATPGEVVPAAVPGFAEAFARTWMTWDTNHPEERDRELARYLAADLGPGAGLEPPPTGHVTITAASTIDARPVGTSAWTLVIEIVTKHGAARHLAVTVHRDQAGRLGVLTPPAFVGPPAPSTALSLPGEREVQDGRVVALARRSLSNLLAGDRGNLRADLAPGAHVPVPLGRLRLDSLNSLTWQQPGRVAAALITATDEHTGERMTLRYELYLTRTGRRPALLSIALPPLTKENP